jgi:cytochrome c oxidase subunit III
VATAAAVDRPNASELPGRPTLVSVGTIVWLSSELMFFAALFAIYFTIRQVAPELWESQPNLLNIPFSATNTVILVLSSITCQLGVLAAERGQVGRLGSVFDVPRWGLREWFILTFLMGGFFNVATGFHALHVTGGLFAFLLVLGRTYAARRFTHEQATSAIVVSYYWHFVDIVWIALYLTIYVVR